MHERGAGALAISSSHLGRTIMASAVVAIAAAVFAWNLTWGFEAWTFDDRRVLAMNKGEVSAKLPALLTSERRAFTAIGKQGDAAQVYLVDFIYTSCLTICQVLGSEFYKMQQLLKEGGLSDNVKLLSVSIDMKRDTPAQLASYAKLHRADGKTWIVGVPIASTELRAVLRDLQVVAVDDGYGGYVHNGAIHLLDANGQLRGLYEYGDWKQAVGDARQIVIPSL